MAFVNTNHEFYTSIMHPLRQVGRKRSNLQGAIASLELFITSLIWVEHNSFQSSEDRKNCIDDYRGEVGQKLRTYIRDNPHVIITEDDLLQDLSDEEGQEEVYE